MFNITLSMLLFMFSLVTFALTDTATILLDQTPTDVSPTTYYVADEDQTSCKGRY